MKSISEREQEIGDFWDRERIFERSVQERPADKEFTFFDGPPFATGLPHYGHLPSSFLKDAVPRYWTMKGYRSSRVWGWDCHGLPIENIIEEKLKLTDKRAIEEYGVRKFCEECRAAVLTYAQEWKKIIRRLGRWVDMDRAYKTMDRSYMESVWWVFAELWKKGLIYEGKKAMHVCPRCETALSNFEVTQGYAEVTDISTTVAFKLNNAKEHLGIDGPVSLLAWTTTPWTLPGNVLLAVGPEIKYALFQNKKTSAFVLLALDRWSATAKKSDTEDYVQHDGILKGRDLEGLTYEPLFPYFANTKNAFRVVCADFVTTDDGTGVVHIAPAFGEDDYRLGERERVGFVQHVGMDGRFTAEVTDFAGQEVKPKEDPSKTDVEIIKWLFKNGTLFHKEKYTHSYPFCWRCDTPLLNYATSSWFVSVTTLKDSLIANNAKTTWVPSVIRDGRFGKWLEGARDWAISRDRYWGTPLPVWKSEGGDVIIVGSIAELERLSNRTVDDLHKHVVDEIMFVKNGKTYRRIPQVLDCWFESGSMPYGQLHYPFENKEQFEAGFPAQFIAEGQDQTRGWFYTLHVLATALTGGPNPSIPKSESCPAFRSVIVNGIVLAEDGKKMSKRLKNYPDLMEVVEKYGADSVRAYILSSPVVRAENLNFSERSVREMYSKFINTLWNVSLFLQQDTAVLVPAQHSGEVSTKNFLDRWILSRLSRLVSTVTQEMDRYEVSTALRPIQEFVTDLSQWYVRRSRDRLKSDDTDERVAVRETLHAVLATLARLCAPFTPFLAESIHQSLPSWSGKADSVHLELWPDADPSAVDEEVEKEMDVLRRVVEIAHALRAEAGIKVRQPLSRIISNQEFSPQAVQLITEELNVKEHTAISGEIPKTYVRKEERGTVVALDTTMTPELKQEGLLRELIRQINAQRKETGLTRSDTVEMVYETGDADLEQVIRMYGDQLKKSIIAHTIVRGKSDSAIEFIVDGKTIAVELQVSGFKL